MAEVHPSVRARGATIVGISTDPVEAQERFVARCDLPFPLLSDVGGEVARRYGVLGWFGLSRRVTFVIDPAGLVREVIATPLPGPHARRIQAAAFSPRSP